MAVAAYPVFLAGVSIASGLNTVSPANPWVSALIVDGWRASLGLPIYEPLGEGHATVMYGPAEPLVLGAVFRVFGPSNIVPELLALVGAIALVIMGWLCVKRFIPAPYQVLVVMSLVAVECHVHYFAEGRPDLPAFAFGFAGLIATYRARSVRGWLIGAALILIGVAFKQTAAMLALVPPAAVLLSSSRALRTLVLSLTPLAFVVVFFTGLSVLAPEVFFYVVDVPRQYQIDFALWLKSTWAFVAAATCLWVAASCALVRQFEDAEWKRRLLWAVMAFAVTLPLSTFTAAKAGGTYNALIPAWFSMIALSWICLAPIVVKLQTPVAFARPVFIALAFLLTSLPVPSGISLTLDRWGAGNTEYAEVLAVVRALPGDAISPEDPTIAIHAGRQGGRSIYAEYDAAGWPESWPDYLANDLHDADYVIDVIDWRQDILSAQDLQRLGFQEEWSNGTYAVWRNTGAPQ